MNLFAQSEVVEAFDEEAFEGSQQGRQTRLEEAFLETMALLEDGKYSSVARKLRHIAVEGHAKSQYVLGEFYRSGAGVRLNYKKANHWLEKSAEQGYPIAMLALGENAFFGKGMRQDYGLARQMLEPVSAKVWAFELPVQDFGIERQARARAAYLMGIMYAEGYGVEVDNEKAVELMTRASNTGEIWASLYMAIEYARGKVVERDMGRSKHFFEMVDLQAFDAVRKSFQSVLLEGVDEVVRNDLEELASSLSETLTESIFDSQIQLAKSVMDTESEDFDPILAESLLKIAADSDYKEAQYLLGFLYAKGLLGEPDYDKALPWLEKSAERGWTMARYNFAVMLRNGLGVKVDEERSNRMLEKAAANGMYFAQLVLDGDETARFVSDREDRERARSSEKEDLRAAYAMTQRRDKGWLESRESNRAKTFKSFRNQAKKGYVRSRHMYAYFNYQGLGDDLDYDEAFKYFRMAADGGYGPSFFYLGYLYTEGKGINRDAREGRLWYERAIEADEAGSACYNNLGVIYEHGKGVPKDLVKAFGFYLKAAELEGTHGSHNLAMMYEDGLGVEENLGKAVEWYSKSADLGHLQAANKLVEIYRENEILKDVEEMAYWLEKAAELGNRQAMLEIAERYFKGLGVPKSQAKAFSWAIQYLNGERFMINYAARLLIADILLDDGWVGHDPEQAHDILKSLAAMGSRDARFRMADIHRRKLIEKAKPSFAFKEYKKLYREGVKEHWSKMDIAKAAFMLSRMYAEGEGVKQSDAKRAEWMKAAADLGLVKAQYLYSGYQISGMGVEVDFEAGIATLDGLVAKRYRIAIMRMARLIAEGYVELEGRESILDELRQLASTGDSKAEELLAKLGYPLEIEEPEPSKESESEGSREYRPAVIS